MKDKLGRKMMVKFVGLRAKSYNYLIDGDIKDKKNQNAQKSVSQKENLNFKIIKTVWKQLNLKIK